MRYAFLSLIVLISFSACTMQADVLTSPASTADSQNFPQSATHTPYPPVLSGIEERTATPSALPTSTFTPTITLTPVPKIIGVVPIQFAPNGTYVDITDSIPNNTSKTYTVSALAGQVTSISVHLGGQADWGYMSMRLSGADGTILCNSEGDSACALFWRGTLPKTQDYLIQLISIGRDQTFTLRVAINPPGVQTQSFQYVSPNTGTSFSYTDEFAVLRAPDSTTAKILPEVKLSYVDTQAFVNRNLVEALFLFGSSSDSTIVQDCLSVSPHIPNEEFIDTITVNGKQFAHSHGGGVAAGSFYEQVMYRTVQSGICYEVTFLMHSFNVGALLPQTVVQEFDRATLLRKFESILSTLVIK